MKTFVSVRSSVVSFALVRAGSMTSTSVWRKSSVAPPETKPKKSNVAVPPSSSRLPDRVIGVETSFSSITMIGSAPEKAPAASVSIDVVQLIAPAAAPPVVLVPAPRLIFAVTPVSDSVRPSMPVSEALPSVAVMAIQERPSLASRSASAARARACPS